MYTVLIAEDELLVRMGIASSVPWAQMDMRVAAETADGQAAWEAFEKYRPDIVIADIRMPKLDGIELLRRIRSLDADCAVIIVTNVEHGPTLDEARRLGITDVLIKAAMKRDDITAAVLRACENLPAGRGNAFVPVDNEALWREFLTTPDMRAEALRRRCIQENAAYFEPESSVLLCLEGGGQMQYRLRTSLVNLFAHRLSEIGDYCVVELHSGVAAALARVGGGERLPRMLSDLARYVRDNFGENMCFAVQRSARSPEQMRAVLHRAEQLLSRPEFADCGVLTLDADGAPVLDQVDAAVRTLRRCMPLGTKGAALAGCADELEQFPAALLRSWSEGLGLGRRVLEMLGGSGEYGSVGALADTLEQAALQAADGVQASVRPEVRAAIEYIQSHIDDELSIRHVSEIAGYHPAYFSNLFKRELGMSYSDFLAGVRIQRAKEMLTDSSRSLQQIAEECGFSDLSYFSAKFKRMTGMAPSQWRSKS